MQVTFRIWEKQGDALSAGASRGNEARGRLDFRFLTSRTVRVYICIVLSH